MQKSTQGQCPMKRHSANNFTGSKAKRIVSLFLCLALLAVLPTATNAASPGQIIITTQDEGYTEEGDWTDSDVAGYNDIPSRYGTAQSSATFTPNIPEAGDYRVSFYKTVSIADSDERGRVDVVHRDGADSKFLDFTTGEADWDDLGVFSFEAGTHGYVKVYAAEHGRASAVKFEPVAKVDPNDFQPQFNDIANSPYVRAITVLGGLGILSGYSDGSFKPEGKITRGEFAVAISRLMGIDEMAETYKNESLFIDVSGGYFGAGQVNYAATLGIIGGYGNGTFGPNDYLTYDQAVKLIVSALGYDIKAIAEGGYPNGYLTTGHSIGVIKSIKADSGEAVAREVVAQMVFNALEIPLMDGAVYRGKDITYKIDHSVTILSKYLKMIKVEGHLFANSHSTMVDDSKTPKGRVGINDMQFFVGETAAESYLGYYVTAYAKEIDDGWELSFVYLNENRNERLIVKAEDIQKETTRSKLVYSSNNRISSAGISPVARMIYNGAALPAYEDVHLKPQSGRVELVKTNGSSEYDVILVTSYIVYVVNGVSGETKQLHDKYLSYLDFDRDDIKYFITKGEEKLELTDLAEWDVLHVAASREIIGANGTRTPDVDNSLLYNIRVSDDKIEGTITEIGESDRGATFSILGREYKLAPNLIEAFKTQRETYPSIGDFGTFHLDIEGRIAALKITAVGSIQYGFVFAGSEIPSIEGGAMLKVLTQKDEKVVILNSKSTVETHYFVNQSLVTGRLEAKALLGLFKEDATDNFRGQTIAYITDAEGKIKTIYKAFDARKIGDIPPDGYPLVLHHDLTGVEMHTGKCNMTFLATEETLIFKVPNKKRVEDGKAEDKEYMLIPNTDLRSGNAVSVESYNLNDVNIAKIIVYYDPNDGTTVSNWTLMTMVDQITTASNEAGEITKKIHGYMDGKKVEAVFSDNRLYQEHPSVPASGLKRGDAVKIDLDSNNEITAMEVVRTTQQMYGDYRYNYGNDIGNEHRFVAGSPAAKDGNNLKLELTPGYERQGQVDKSNLIEVVSDIAEKPVMIYDAIKDDVYVGSLGDIIDAKLQQSIGGLFLSKCLLQTTWARPQSLFYYKLPLVD